MNKKNYQRKKLKLILKRVKKVKVKSNNWIQNLINFKKNLKNQIKNQLENLMLILILQVAWLYSMISRKDKWCWIDTLCMILFGIDTFLVSHAVILEKKCLENGNYKINIQSNQRNLLISLQISNGKILMQLLLKDPEKNVVLYV